MYFLSSGMCGALGLMEAFPPSLFAYWDISFGTFVMVENATHPNKDQKIELVIDPFVQKKSC